MSLGKFIIAVIGLLGCLWAVNTYIGEAGIKLFGTVLLILVLIAVVLNFCGVLGPLGLG